MNEKKRLMLLMPLVAIFSLMPISTVHADEKVYDFDDIVFPSTTHKATCDIDDEIKENDPAIGIEFTDEDYACISVSDDLRSVCRSPYAYNYAQCIFRFKILEMPLEFEISWEGYLTFIEVPGTPGGDTPADIGLDIWNFATESWEFIAEPEYFAEVGPPWGDPGEPHDCTITKHFTDVFKYINANGFLYITVYGKNSHHAAVRTDYVFVKVVYENPENPDPVGGTVLSVNKISLIAPFVLAVVMALAIVARASRP